MLVVEKICVVEGSERGAVMSRLFTLKYRNGITAMLIFSEI